MRQRQRQSWLLRTIAAGAVCLFLFIPSQKFPSLSTRDECIPFLLGREPRTLVRGGSTQTVIAAPAGTLAPPVGVEETYVEMFGAMWDEIYDEHQRIIDDDLDKAHAADKLNALTEYPEINNEFEAIMAQYPQTHDALNAVLDETGGVIQIRELTDGEDFLVFRGRTVYGHAGKYLTVYATTAELKEARRDDETGRRARLKIIGRFLHEIRARSTRTKEIWDAAYAGRTFASPQEAVAFAAGLEDQFERGNVTLQNEVAEHGSIQTQELADEFAAGLVFTRERPRELRDYAARSTPPFYDRGNRTQAEQDRDRRRLQDLLDSRRPEETAIVFLERICEDGELSYHHRATSERLAITYWDLRNDAGLRAHANNPIREMRERPANIRTADRTHVRNILYDVQMHGGTITLAQIVERSCLPMHVVRDIVRGRKGQPSTLASHPALAVRPHALRTPEVSASIHRVMVEELESLQEGATITATDLATLVTTRLRDLEELPAGHADVSAEEIREAPRRSGFPQEKIAVVNERLDRGEPVGQLTPKAQIRKRRTLELVQATPTLTAAHVVDQLCSEGVITLPDPGAPDHRQARATCISQVWHDLKGTGVTPSGKYRRSNHELAVHREIIIEEVMRRKRLNIPCSNAELVAVVNSDPRVTGAADVRPVAHGQIQEDLSPNGNLARLRPLPTGERPYALADLEQADPGTLRDILNSLGGGRMFTLEEIELLVLDFDGWRTGTLLPDGQKVLRLGVVDEMAMMVMRESAWRRLRCYLQPLRLDDLGQVIDILSPRELFIVECHLDPRNRWRDDIMCEALNGIEDPVWEDETPQVTPPFLPELCASAQAKLDAGVQPDRWVVFFGGGNTVSTAQAVSRARDPGCDERERIIDAFEVDGAATPLAISAATATTPEASDGIPRARVETILRNRTADLHLQEINRRLERRAMVRHDHQRVEAAFNQLCSERPEGRFTMRFLLHRINWTPLGGVEREPMSYAAVYSALRSMARRDPSVWDRLILGPAAPRDIIQDRNNIIQIVIDAREGRIDGLQCPLTTAQIQGELSQRNPGRTYPRHQVFADVEALIRQERLIEGGDGPDVVVRRQERRRSTEEIAEDRERIGQIVALARAGRLAGVHCPLEVGQVRQVLASGRFNRDLSWRQVRGDMDALVGEGRLVATGADPDVLLPLADEQAGRAAEEIEGDRELIIAIVHDVRTGALPGLQCPLTSAQIRAEVEARKGESVPEHYVYTDLTALTDDGSLTIVGEDPDIVTQRRTAAERGRHRAYIEELVTRVRREEIPDVECPLGLDEIRQLLAELYQVELSDAQVRTDVGALMTEYRLTDAGPDPDVEIERLARPRQTRSRAQRRSDHRRILTVIRLVRQGAIPGLRCPLSREEICRELETRFGRPLSYKQSVGDLRALIDDGQLNAAAEDPDVILGRRKKPGAGGGALYQGGGGLEAMLAKGNIETIVAEALLRALHNNEAYLDFMNDLHDCVYLPVVPGPEAALSAEQTLVRNARIANANIAMRHPAVRQLLLAEDRDNSQKLNCLVTDVERIDKVVGNRVGLIVPARFITEHIGVLQVLEELRAADTEFTIVVDAIDEAEQRIVEALNLPGVEVICADPERRMTRGQRIEQLVKYLSRKVPRTSIGMIENPRLDVEDAVAEFRDITEDIYVGIPRLPSPGQMVSVAGIFHDVIDAIAERREDRVFPIALPPIATPSKDLEKAFRDFRESIKLLQAA